MADKVKLSKDGNSIDFVHSESIPTSVKKFRHSSEIEGFYRFVFENDLQKETFEIMERIVQVRKAKKLKEKLDAQPAKKAEAAAKKEVLKKAAAAAAFVAAPTAKPLVKSAPKIASKAPVAKGKSAPTKKIEPKKKTTGKKK